jgi:hypothetical protein
MGWLPPWAVGLRTGSQVSGLRFWALGLGGWGLLNLSGRLAIQQTSQCMSGFSQDPVPKTQDWTPKADP